MLQSESHIDLRKLLDTTPKHLMSLKAVDIPIDTWDNLLIPVLSTKLDSVTLRE